MKNYLTDGFFGVANHAEFMSGLKHSVDHLKARAGIYAGDQLFTYHRNLGFLDDEKFMAAFNRHAATPTEKAILWRQSVVAWGARNALRLEGDLVECACYKGTTARIICDYLELAGRNDRRYFLYDLFEHDPSLPHHAMPEHGKDLFDSVKARFADCPNAFVTKGKVPEILTEVAPEKIAFMHLDLNNADAEVGALEVLFDRMVPGAVLVLDDYGWLGYRAQKLAEDAWFEKRGYGVLELPTGQGLLTK